MMTQSCCRKWWRSFHKVSYSPAYDEINATSQAHTVINASSINYIAIDSVLHSVFIAFIFCLCWRSYHTCMIRPLIIQLAIASYYWFENNIYSKGCDNSGHIKSLVLSRVLDKVPLIIWWYSCYHCFPNDSPGGVITSGRSVADGLHNVSFN